MRKLLVLLLLIPLLFGLSATDIYGEPYANKGQEEQQDTIKPYKRGAIRSPRRSYNPGITPATPARRDNTVRNPAPPRATPTPRTGFGGFLGGMFGGLALGTILGSLFNPFAGFSLGFPLLSLLSLALWIIVIFAVVRLFRKRKNY
ncbi:hypothetical protein ACFSL6_26240 [Paenibacillus thailandensis]|uniref:Preprotein translocase subunit Tim44 n=1 Tax=Paenibacillus thailandensis TaxID=393250 RepID=A0ABW5QRC9_9BACL